VGKTVQISISLNIPESLGRYRYHPLKILRVAVPRCPPKSPSLCKVRQDRTIVHLLHTLSLYLFLKGLERCMNPNGVHSYSGLRTFEVCFWKIGPTHKSIWAS